MQILNLREQRELRGWTQKDLAHESGVSVRSIAGYETGATIRPNTARKLAEALDVEVADLVVTASGKEEAPSSLQPPLNGFAEEERRAATEWLRGQGFGIATMPLEDLHEQTSPPYNRPRLVKLSRRAGKEAQRLMALYRAGDLPRGVGFALELTQSRKFIFDLAIQVCDAAAQSRSETG